MAESMQVIRANYKLHSLHSMIGPSEADKHRTLMISINFDGRVRGWNDVIITFGISHAWKTVGPVCDVFYVASTNMWVTDSFLSEIHNRPSCVKTKNVQLPVSEESSLLIEEKPEINLQARIPHEFIYIFDIWWQVEVCSMTGSAVW